MKSKSKSQTFQTIESIEQEYWKNKPEYESTLVERIHLLRKKNIQEFTVEDLRITIGQHLSLPILIPIAIDALEKNILAEGNMYPGDLLKQVFMVPPEFWADNPDLKDKFKKVFVKNAERIKSSGLHERNKERYLSAYDLFLNNK